MIWTIDSRLIKESNVTTRQPCRAPHHVIHLILQRRRQANEGLVNLTRMPSFRSLWYAKDVSLRDAPVVSHYSYFLFTIVQKKLSDVRQKFHYLMTLLKLRVTIKLWERKHRSAISQTKVRPGWSYRIIPKDTLIHRPTFAGECLT